ncbi:hypothetical protein P59_223 [Bacillus phage P59]|nr:hypothetical protein P59_223 [Bacillus phage P59]
MAKQFSWDSEELIGTHEVSDKVHHEVRICTLKDKEYVSVSEKAMTNEGWKYKKNRTLPMDVFKAVQGIVEEAGK